MGIITRAARADLDARIQGSIVSIVFALIWICSAFSAPAAADPPSYWRETPAESVAVDVDRPLPVVTGTLTLDEAFRLALQYSPALTARLWATRAEVERARDEARIANPTLEAAIENFDGGLDPKRQELTLSLGQPLDLGGRRGALARVAAALRNQGSAELAIERRDVLRETADSFLDTWALERRVEYLAHAEEIGQTAIAAARERTRIGATPVTEALRAESDWAQRGIERRKVSSDLVASRRALAFQWGASVATFDSVVLPPPESEIPPLDSLLAAVSQSPEVRQAAAETAVAAARLRTARAERIPELTVLGGVRYLREDEATGLIAAVSAPIPIWNAGGARIAAAEAEHRAATAREKLIRVRLEREVATAFDLLANSRDALELARTRAEPAAREALVQLESGYRGGRFSYLDYLEGQRSILDIELMLVDATRDYWKARLTLEGLTGGGAMGVGGTQ